MRIGPHDPDERVVLIAEIGNNHEGDQERARTMIDRAAEAGADAVKFQAIVPERLVAADQPERLEQLRRLCLPVEAFEGLAAHARARGVAFVLSAFDVDTVRELDHVVDAWKIASSDNDFGLLLDAVARTGRPVLISRGLADEAAITSAVQRIDAGRPAVGAAGAAGAAGGAGATGAAGAPGASDAMDSTDSDERADDDAGIAVLHCVCRYPTPDDDANLLAIGGLASIGDVVGWSDHTLGITAAIAAVALGARVVEKHFTLAHDLSDFRDHALSATPEEFAAMAEHVRRTERMLGDGALTPSAAEREAAIGVRRVIVARQAIDAGALIQPDDIDWRRAADGFRVGEESQVVGRRTVRAIGPGMPIRADDLRPVTRETSGRSSGGRSGGAIVEDKQVTGDRATTGTPR